MQKKKEKRKQVAKERKCDKACHGKGYIIACMDKVSSTTSGGFGLPLWFLLGLLWALEIGLKWALSGVKKDVGPIQKDNNKNENTSNMKYDEQ